MMIMMMMVIVIMLMMMLMLLLLTTELTIPVLKGGIQRHGHPSPDGHVPRVVVLHVRVVLVQLPVHVTRHEVGAFVEAPGEHRVDVLHVGRDAELRDGAPFPREPRHHSVGVVRPVPVACNREREREGLADY